MTKGTASMGKRGANPTHRRCRRCGHASFHIQRERCARCGYPDAKIRVYAWMKPRKRGQ
ncbi:MAG TPA: 50S ribosomal protein L37e [Candidatus Thermoplasmatota archaeon]|jgi:large subunit ribosomal protein L37e|nr:50S ribosomal protein L37e [Candidatus Thermoplasmatota archaeon]